MCNLLVGLGGGKAACKLKRADANKQPSRDTHTPRTEEAAEHDDETASAQTDH